MMMTAKNLTGLDLSNVIQDVQTIANQTTLDTLLVTVMKIWSHYTGAQKSLLLLNENEQLQVKAIFTRPLDEVLVLQAIPSKTSKQFPQTIITKVYISNAAVILDYRLNQEDFADDPYSVTLQHLRHPRE